jgi:hypothetical protein
VTSRSKAETVYRCDPCLVSNDSSLPKLCTYIVSFVCYIVLMLVVMR